MKTKHWGLMLVERPGLATIWCAFGVAALLAPGAVCRADKDYVVARPQVVIAHFQAYARVGPVAVMPLRAATAGVVSGLKVLPGDSVRAGQKLAELGGPEVAALLAQREAAAKSAQADLASAQKSLAIQRQNVAVRLSTQQTLLQAESAAADAKTRLESAQATLRALRQLIEVTSPTDGTVLTIDAADGERVDTGQSLLTLQPASRLWLKADYYGADIGAVHVGISGEFFPLGGAAIPVKVSSIFGPLKPDGARSVGLFATTPTPRWLNGEFGTLKLNGGKRSLPAVPTRALILDRGQWWVLVHTPKGDHAQAVTPGPARGWQTFIEKGLKPGDQVVAENAYLEFHRSISKTYQPPD
jgi:RND family efflux transporter MFP subunit